MYSVFVEFMLLTLKIEFHFVPRVTHELPRISKFTKTAEWLAPVTYGHVSGFMYVTFLKLLRFIAFLRRSKMVLETILPIIFCNSINETPTSQTYKSNIDNIIQN
jgi:hypothetical protein